MSAHLNQPPDTGDVPNREVLAPLIDLVGKPTKAMAELLTGTDDPVRLLNEYTPALEAIDIHNAYHRQLLHGFGRLCCHILHLPAYLTFPVELEDDEMPFAGNPLSRVWKGLHSGRVVAMKELLAFSLNEGAVARRRRILWRDVALWKRLSHENVIPFFGVDTTRRRHFTFVYPWAENQDIQRYLKANPGASRPDLLLQATKGLQYLHSVDIIHGTLKAANVLINSSGGVWLADYGLSPFRYDNLRLDLAIHLEAPEVPAAEVALKPADIFSFAMLVVEVFTGQKPFGRSEYGAITWLRISMGERPERSANSQELGFSDGMWDLVQRCWAQHPDERPIIDDVVETWDRLTRNPRPSPFADGIAVSAST